MCLVAVQEKGHTSTQDLLSAMPPSARKSSVGAARRAGQKSHVPYRGDDPTVGKKTGISVQPVPRGSDGFEPFDQLIDQLKEHEPARTRKKKKSVPQDREEDEDEDGEMSMDVDSASAISQTLPCCLTVHRSDTKLL